MKVYWRLLRINRHGIQFSFGGDDVLLMWPTHWHKGYRFISFGFDSCFRTLRELEQLWDEYFEAERKAG